MEISGSIFSKILNKLDYEASLHYPGEPLLQKGTITPQIRTLTTQAHYSCKEETSILFDVDEFNLKNLAENDFFTLGTQVQSIHEESAAAELAFDFMENGRLSAVITDFHGFKSP